MSGLDFFNARYFSGALGRFTSVDPDPGSMDVTNPQSFNRYAYVLGNPLANTDPTGMDPVMTILRAAAGGGRFLHHVMLRSGSRSQLIEIKPSPVHTAT